MSIKILMPALSPTMTEGNLHKWLIKIGDEVKAGDILAEIETDKATMEVEAVDEGKVTKILVSEGTEGVKVNSVIAILDGTEEDDKLILEEKKDDNKKNKILNSDIKNLQNISSTFDNDSAINNNNKPKEIDNSRLFASPYAKKIANEKNIDLKFLSGSGPQGRIIKRDLENKTENSFYNNIDQNSELIEPSSMRKIIAERTTKTKQSVPHYYLSIESEVVKLIKLKNMINAQQNEIKVSINDILVKALSLAQKNCPETNIAWHNGKILKFNSVDISIAVALKEGLITPILKNAEKKGIIEISKEIRKLIKKTKEGKLTPEEYNGGTISISNLGMFGITEFKAIINPPQSSILAVGTIQKLPREKNNEIQLIDVIKFTLSVDHRVLDGAVAAKFLKKFNDIIEDPFELWLDSNDLEII